ncbi:MAG: T9SS type A sorting domain-containing protein, partial [Bacteroidales bacterium]|nr:T9SS type A sorting domain-containing protein [Bacteroidales bacterium]
LTEKVAPMYGGENRNYTFKQQYRVPRLSVNGAQASYNVKVFLTALDGDVDLSSDTAKVEACVQGGVGVESIDADRWMVGQNVPNPAAELTRIPYVIPEAGVLTLRIMGMNGQVLYREEVNAEAGGGDIRVNLSDLAAGVYYYSVEYRGERIVKKMNVVR